MRLRIPATTANLGPGFDTLGLALRLYNEVDIEVTDRPGLTLEITGEGQGHLPADERHLLVKCIRRAVNACGGKFPGGLLIRQHNRLPLARGLGSSAATVVAGLMAAKIILGLESLDILAEATAIEGHPDNVAPCLSGGLTASFMGESGVVSCMHTMHECWEVAVAVPNFELSTAEARRLLPTQIPVADTVFNLGRLAVLLGGLREGRTDLVREAVGDRVHQPYRLPLIPGVEQVFSRALEAGGSGAFISGAGPTLAALVDSRKITTESVAQAMVSGFAAAGVEARGLELQVDHRGATMCP